MVKTLRKIFAMLLAVCMMMSLLSVNVFAAEKTSAIQIVEQGGKVYYLADPEEGGVAGEDNFDVWTSKTIAGTENEDEFEVTLQVGTTVKAVSSNSAVVLLMDASGSMMADETGNRWYGNEDTMPADRMRRIQYTREAAREFAQAYVENAGGAKRMLSIVEFGNTAKTMLPWTDANINGELKQSVEEAIESVEVNFTVDPAKSYWNEVQASKDFGQVDFWDPTEYEAVMVDEFEEEFSSYFKDRFESFVEVTEVETVTEDGTPGVTEVFVCTFEGCENSSPDHKHCAEGCGNDAEHKHCLYPGCDDPTPDHEHCDYCKNTEPHKHCAHAGCDELTVHLHCEKCGGTEAHTHVVGCTLQDCEETSDTKHIHCCTYGSETIQDNLKYSYMYYPGKAYYGYRCKDPDPAHTHEVVDSDKCYLTATKYCGAVWAVGTNMEAGMLLARNLVTTGLAEGGAIEDIDNVYVILLSDGRPTWSIASESKSAVNLMDDVYLGSDWDALESIVSEGDGDNTALAEDIKNLAELYAILYTNDLNATFSLGSDHPLNGVSVGDWIEKSGPYYVGADLTLKSPSAAEIGEAFASFGERINLQTKAWIATEKLSEHVTFKGFEDNGNKYAAENDGTISWNVGNMEPESGTGGMEDPYVYTLKYRVTLNSAEIEVRDISKAHDANDTLDGIWTNEGKAVLKYFMAKEDQLKNMTPDEIKAILRDATFADVSVKGIYGDLSFIKKDGETGEPIADVGFTLKDSKGKAYGSQVFSDGEGEVTFTDIPRGEYTLEETTVPNGIQKMSDLALKESWGTVTLDDGRDVPEVIENWKIGTVVPDPDPNPNPNPNPRPNPTPGPNPDVNIEEEDTPLAEMPEEDVPLTDLPKEDVPLAVLPEEDVPLAGVPKTGDMSALWMALSALSGTGLAGVTFLGRKKRED